MAMVKKAGKEPPFKMKVDKQMCVQCAEAEATTNDHIPPKSLYPKPRSNDINLYTVPTCHSCNSGASKEDEEFKVSMSIETGEFRDNRSQIIDSIARTLGANQRVANQVFSTKRNVYSQRRSTMLVPAVRVTFSSDNYCKVIKRMIRALYWRETGNCLGKDTEITILPNREINFDLANSLKELMDDLKPRKLNQNSFTYKVYFDDAGTSVWGMQFFKKHTVFGYAMPPRHKAEHEGGTTLPT